MKKEADKGQGGGELNWAQQNLSNEEEEAEFTASQEKKSLPTHFSKD